ncbi:MAG: VWA domain-containing protein [Bryobacteraceae bacterium]|nr:VWA domain-containing protein [Bryobacteraceae bacterium]
MPSSLWKRSNLFLAACAALLAQEQPLIRTGTQEILVDAVVRDKRGRIVHGLSQDAFVVTEDGVPQPITSWREVRVRRETAAPNPEDVRAKSGQQQQGANIRLTGQPRFVSLIFERLGPDGRRLAKQAALDFLDTDMGENVYYGVFVIQRRFHILQRYTNDRAALKRAVERATSMAPTDVANDNYALDRMAQAVGGSAGAGEAATNQAAAGGAPPQVNGGAMADEQAQRMVENASVFASMLTRDEVGHTAIVSLWAIVSEMAKVEGRKSILYFCEGMYFPESTVRKKDAMISAANRANVSIYVVDARGLTVSSDQTAANKMLEQAAALSRRSRNVETQSADLRAFDVSENSTRANLQMAMREVAESTGGSLIANTNDFRPSLRRLSEEFNTYYELVYRPTNPAYDGRFRAIKVEVKQPELTVQARSGYFALPPMKDQIVFPYEMPLLLALGQPSLPRTMEIRSNVIPYQFRDGLQQAALVFDLPLREITFTREPQGKLYRTHITVLALVKDERGEVVTKISRDVPLNEPAERVEQFRQGRFIVSRPFAVAPGRYTVEAAAMDHESGKVSARKGIFVVPAAKSVPLLSGLTLLRTLDKPAELRDPGDPFHLKQGRVVPTLQTQVRGGKGSVLSVFFSLYPQPEAPAPRLILDLLRDGKVLGRSEPPLPAPDERGAVPYIAHTPLDTVEPGQYEFRVTLVQGEQIGQQTLPIVIE